MSTNMRGYTALALACLVLAACNGRTGPQDSVSSRLNSGITSENGGGQRALRNNNSVGAVSTPVR